MKKNKGYYSWIHGLKAASMEAHFKGKKMLAESKPSKPHVGVNPSDLEKAHKDLMTSTDGPGRPPKGPHISPEHPGDVAKTSAQIYAEILSGKKAKDLKPTVTDITGDNKVDASDVQADAADNNIADEETSVVDPNLLRRPSQIGIEARAEAGTTTPEDIEVEAQNAQETEYMARQEDEQEGIEGIIDRMMRGKR